MAALSDSEINSLIESTVEEPVLQIHEGHKDDPVPSKITGVESVSEA